MRVLITGCGGFIAKYLYNSIYKNHQFGDWTIGIDRKSEYTYSTHPAIAIDRGPKEPGGHLKINCQLDNYAWVNRLLTEYEPDVIYHYAGCSTVSSPDNKVWQSNVTTTYNLLSNLPEGKPVNFILASSVLAEECSSVYGASKAAAENLVRAYTKLGRINGLCLRLVAVCGVGNTHGAVRDIVRKFVQDDVVKVFGKFPGSCKPYLHIDDVVNLTKYLSNDNYYYRWSPITISPGIENLTIDQICTIVKEESGIDKKIEWSGKTWPGDQQHVFVPNTTLKSLLKGNEKILLSSEEAVRKAVREILELEYGIRK